MNDSPNIDPADATVAYRDEHHALVESRGVITYLNKRRVSMACAVKAGGAVDRVAHPQSAPSGTGRPSNRKDCNLAVLKNDVEVRVVQDVCINSEGRTETPTD